MVPWGLRFPSQRRRAGHELLFRCGPRRGDGGVDAAGGVRLTSHAALELRRAIAAEHEVGVAVDPAGENGPAGDIRFHVGGGGMPRRPDPENAAVADDKGGVAQASLR